MVVRIGDDIKLPREWPRHLRAAITSSFQLMPFNITSAGATGGVTPYGPSYARFQCRITSPQHRKAEWREASGIITSLRGMNGALRMVDYNRLKTMFDEEVTPSEAQWADGSIWSDGSSWESGHLPPIVTIDEPAPAGSRSVVVRALPENTNRVFRPGDLSEARPNGQRALHSHLYEAIYESRTNADGKTRVYFEPGLRAALVAGDSWVIRRPEGVFRLASDNEGLINRSAPGNLGNFGLTLAEVLPEDIPPM